MEKDIVCVLLSIMLLMISWVALILYRSRERLRKIYRLSSDSPDLKQRELEQIIQFSPAAILLHEGFYVTYANQEALSLLGAIHPDEVAGQKITDILLADSRQSMIDFLNGVYEHRATAMTSSPGGHLIIHRDGKLINVEASTSAIPMRPNCAVTILRDVTERKKEEVDRRYAEDMIRQSEDRYFRLQMSLDQFSSDLFGMLKEEELSCRFVKEVCQVLGTDNVSFIEVDRHHGIYVTRRGVSIPEGILETILEMEPEQLPYCQLFDTLDGHFIKVGDIRGKSCILCIGEPSPQLLIQAARAWLETITRYVSVLYDNFRLIENLTRELEETASQQITPVWLLRLMFQLSEKERKALAQDLHDSALQEQIVWYRKLDQLMTDTELNEEMRGSLETIRQGLLDVMYQIRLTCTELRPPMLRELGLERSLENLFELTQLRSDYAISFESSGLNRKLGDDMLIGLYRMVQEMLSNATKHSRATQVWIGLHGDVEEIILNYKDNGIGMKLQDLSLYAGNMGVYGIKERVRSLHGEAVFLSAPNEGLSVTITLPPG